MGYAKFQCTQSVARALAGDIGRRVKMADLRDNCDLSRIAEPKARDHERIAKYRRALAYLESLDSNV